MAMSLVRFSRIREQAEQLAERAVDGTLLDCDIARRVAGLGDRLRAHKTRQDGARGRRKGYGLPSTVEIAKLIGENRTTLYVRSEFAARRKFLKRDFTGRQ